MLTVQKVLPLRPNLTYKIYHVLLKPKEQNKNIT